MKKTTYSLRVHFWRATINLLVRLNLLSKKDAFEIYSKIRGIKIQK